MFNLAAMQALLNAKPFAAFRFVVSEGGPVTVPSREMVIVGRTFAVVGIPDPNARQPVISGWTTVWYALVARVEMLQSGSSPAA